MTPFVSYKSDNTTAAALALAAREGAQARVQIRRPGSFQDFQNRSRRKILPLPRSDKVMDALSGNVLVNGTRHTRSRLASPDSRPRRHPPEIMKLVGHAVIDRTRTIQQ